MPKVFANSKTPCGKCYFTDGHIEDIICYTHYSEEDIVFNTESGRYQFRLWAEPAEKEMLYADNNPRILMIPKHAFFKYDHESDHHYVVDIEKIEIE